MESDVVVASEIDRDGRAVKDDMGASSGSPLQIRVGCRNGARLEQLPRRCSRSAG